MLDPSEYKSVQISGDIIDLTIIVPSRNEERFIKECLDSLLCQDYQGLFEIIVVDGESEDRTREIVVEYCKRDSRIRLITNTRRITPVAFNLGIREARGRYILTVGAHWYVPRDYLRRIDDAFRRYPNVDCVGGRIVRLTKTETGVAIEAARKSSFGGGVSLRNYLMEERIIDKANIAYIWRRGVFDKVGYFDERFVKNQDNEFNLRTLAAGLLTLYAPDIVFYYYGPQDYSKLFRQVFGYSSFIPMIQLKHRRLSYGRAALPAMGLLIYVALTLSSVLGVMTLYVPVSILSLYATIILFGAVRCKPEAGIKHSVVRIVVAYFTIHVGTGVGYLRGLFRRL